MLLLSLAGPPIDARGHKGDCSGRSLEHPCQHSYTSDCSFAFTALVPPLLHRCCVPPGCVALRLLFLSRRDTVLRRAQTDQHACTARALAQREQESRPSKQTSTHARHGLWHTESKRAGPAPRLVYPRTIESAKYMGTRTSLREAIPIPVLWWPGRITRLAEPLEAGAGFAHHMLGVPPRERSHSAVHPRFYHWGALTGMSSAPAPVRRPYHVPGLLHTRVSKSGTLSVHYCQRHSVCVPAVLL